MGKKISGFWFLVLSRKFAASTLKSKASLLHYPAVNDLEAALKLLARPFPAVVAPQPVLRSAVDCLLHTFEIDVGQLKLAHRRWLTGDDLELALISASSHTLDVHIDDGLVLGVDNALNAREHGSFLIEEGEPVVDIVPCGHLVIDITQYCGAAVPLVAEYPAQGFLHRDTIRTHAATRLEHDAVDHLILERMINLPHDRPVLYQRVNPQHQRRHPFPVAVVSQQQGNGLAAVENFGHLLATLEGHAAHDVLVADRRVLHRLDQDVTEVAVELHPQLLEFLVALVRISVTQVLADHAVAVTQHVGDHHKHDVTEHVVKPQRHHRQPVPRAIYQPKRYIVDYPFHYRLRKYNIFGAQTNAAFTNNAKIQQVLTSTAPEVFRNSNNNDKKNFRDSGK